MARLPTGASCPTPPDLPREPALALGQHVSGSNTRGGRHHDPGASV